jgi:hypothetical protein
MGIPPFYDLHKTRCEGSDSQGTDHKELEYILYSVSRLDAILFSWSVLDHALLVSLDGLNA